MSGRSQRGGHAFCAGVKRVRSPATTETSRGAAKHIAGSACAQKRLVCKFFSGAPVCVVVVWVEVVPEVLEVVPVLKPIVVVVGGCTVVVIVVVVVVVAVAVDVPVVVLGGHAWGVAPFGAVGGAAADLLPRGSLPARLTAHRADILWLPLQDPSKTLRGNVGECFEDNNSPSKRFRGGGAALEGVDLVESICASFLGDAEKVRALFQQDWVKGWTGWRDLATAKSDNAVMEIAGQFLGIALDNLPARAKSNQERLKELEAEGLHLQVAETHGVNNCLIDSLLINLSATGIAPRPFSIAEREKLCAQCRRHLNVQYKVPHGVYLDGHRDAPRILDFFVRLCWKVEASVRVWFYDSLDHSALGLPQDELEYVDYTHGDRVIFERLFLRIYNHTVPTGHGFHFDALLPAAVQSVPSNVTRGCSGNTEASAATRVEVTKQPSTVAENVIAEGVKETLQSFFSKRGADIQIVDADVQRVLGAWSDNLALGMILQTLLQAGLLHADSGPNTALRLADQYRGYHNCCKQGQGRQLNEERQSRLEGPAQKASPLQGPSRAVETDEIPDPCKTQKGKRANSAADADLPTHPVRKRLRGKQADPGPLASQKASSREPADLAADDYVLSVWHAAHGNPDPRAQQDKEIEMLGQQFRTKPTLPTWVANASERLAFDIPTFACSLMGCTFEADDEASLNQHIIETHGSLLGTVAQQFSLSMDAGKRLLEAYRLGMTWRCQQHAPVAHPALDRKALRLFCEARGQERVGTGICFVCAQRFPYTNGMGVGDPIRWNKLVGPSAAEVLSLTQENIEKWLGYEAYWANYANQHPIDTQAGLREALQDWTAEVHLADAVTRIICCPEDKQCPKGCPPKKVCKHCCAPVCDHCWKELRLRKTMPRHALANDLLVFYPPETIYQKEVTFMELVCASPCFTAMACFSLEKKFLGDRAMDQDAFMPRNRLAARGNATTFPLAWEDLLQAMQGAASEAEHGTLKLPRVGAELARVFNVIIKSGNRAEDADKTAKVIHQARVRRDVVLELLEEARKRAHPAYMQLNMLEARARAEELPEDGVPPEIIALLGYDNDLDNIQRQKAATPVRESMSAEELEKDFASTLKPNAVVGERTSAGMCDTNADKVLALRQLAAQSRGFADEAEITIHTGNRLLDQFEPWYFAFAFAFVFPYGTGMPDPPSWSCKERHRRVEEAPRIELSAWMRCMARRCEAQINRDWTFGFTVWNLFFRSTANLSRPIWGYDTPVFDEQDKKFKRLTGADLEAGALQLVKALDGSYIDTHGATRAVKGDIAKVQYVRNLQPAARKLLRNMRQVARSLPGTQEARRQMRFEITALRVRYGVPLFITVSPDEAHQMLFIRMARTRESDPVRRASPMQEWLSGDRNFPPLDEDMTVSLPVETLRRALPVWLQRRTTLARDPLASVDGFHVLLRLLMRHIFGLNVCHRCPDCDATQHPCMDAVGSSATLLGGTFGRVDAMYVTIEAQKSSGSLHGHIQCFVQCVHQHTPLTEIFLFAQHRLNELRRDYGQYQGHVAHSVYTGQTETQMAAGIAAAEETWPEHASAGVLIRCPAYQQFRALKPACAEEAAKWQKMYLEDDVVQLQYLKQHHYHPVNAESGERMPLRGCQKQEKKGVCKSDFPRQGWLCSDAKVLCPCQLQRHGFPLQGRRNRLGALHGPYGHPYLNPCHPAVLASMRGGNNDVQVPYRLPYDCETCGATCNAKDRQTIALAAQRAQDAQTGYCSDYCSKNQPMGFHEIKEFQKGHIALHAGLKNASVQTIGKRHANRFLSDAYCKGLVRGQVECCNLRANHVEGQIVAAERISTAPFAMFPGQAYVELYEHMNSHSDERLPKSRYVTTRAAPGSGGRHLREGMAARAYGHRPSDSPCWWLSPYEFTLYWEIVPTRVPYNAVEWNAAPADAWDVTLTRTGIAKMASTPATEPARLRAGAHYRIRVEASADCVLFPPTAANAVLRHNWFLRRRARPRCPQWAQAPVPRGFDDNAEHNARLTSIYFRAWTCDVTRATYSVPYLGHLLGNHPSWEASLRAWLLRLPSAETKRHVGNFLSVYRVRSAGEAEANSDDDDADEPLELKAADLSRALLTEAPAQQRRAGKGANDDRATRVEKAMTQIDAVWSNKGKPTWQPEHNSEYSARDSAAAKKASRQKPSQPLFADEESNRAGGTATRDAPRATGTDVTEWLAKVETSQQCNPEQYEFCRKVAGRVCEEMETEQTAQGPEGGQAKQTEPLRWVLHGGPGTGKSYTLRKIRQELFEGVLGWQHGVEFQIVSFQAVMAELLDGDTIHHALGLDWAGDKAQTLLKSLERAQQVLQWRWLILDEFSMVSAELLGQLELRCRELMRDLSLGKYGVVDGHVRPFGGLNIILAGDLFQLPPPKGTFLGDIPWDLVAGKKASKKATGHYGQTLLWGGPEAGVQGMTELQRCERTGDEWLAEVQEQLRKGELSNDNHAFLHGRPTTVPGSAVNGSVRCGTKACADLMESKKAPEKILGEECAVCAADRRSRRLVATGDDDTRFAKEFAEAVSIFSTNDIKYHANKRRALEWAHARGKQVHVAVARDRASAAVLQEKPDLKDAKVQWLQRHDKECGGLCGMLPLCVGLPVRATEHLDRGRGILKGCKGTIVGWSSVEASGSPLVLWNKLPEVVYVKFVTTTAWEIDGLPANVYPVVTCKRVWFLDRQRQYPQLRVWRTQFPLAPAFAITAHVAQGQTIVEGVMTDLCIGSGGSSFTAYVAFTRVQGRGKLLIFRPFDAAPFQKGIGLGRELLLRHLRGQSIDWQALLSKYCEERSCVACSERKQSCAFTVGQWKRDDRDRVCRECTKAFADAGLPWQCSQCKDWFAEDNFPQKHRQRACSFYRVCLTCEECKRCVKCQERKPEADFGPAAWKARAAAKRICRACATRERGYWRCSACETRQQQIQFSAWQRRRGYGQDGSQICNTCFVDMLITDTARRGHQRLARLRARIHRQHILADIRAEIAAWRAKALQDARATGHLAGADPANAKALQPEPCVTQTAEEKLYEYKCPFCSLLCSSPVYTGRVNHSSRCGKKFRVDSGVVVGRQYKHACPACGTVVASKLQFGRIRVHHKNHRGRACPCVDWTVHT